MKKITGAAVAMSIVGALIAWSIAASAIWCSGYNVACRQDEWPLLQWWFVLPDWQHNWWVSTWLALSGLIPTMALVTIGIMYLSLRRRKGQDEVYGKTDWSDANKMCSNGVTTKRRPF